MARTTPTFNTLEDLTAAAIKGNDYKYLLHKMTSTWFVDAEAGLAWQNARSAAEDASDAANPLRDAKGNRIEGAYDARRQAEEAWFEANPRPAQHQVTHYSLQTNGYGRSDYSLSNELGEQLEGIWKKHERWSNTFVGYMTLTGMLKRLGKTDIGEQVKSAKAKAEAEAARNTRNWRRREIANQLKQLREALTKAQAAGCFSGIDTNLMSLNMLDILTTEEGAQ